MKIPSASSGRAKPPVEPSTLPGFPRRRSPTPSQLVAASRSRDGNRAIGQTQISAQALIHPSCVPWGIPWDSDPKWLRVSGLFKQNAACHTGVMASGPMDWQAWLEYPGGSRVPFNGSCSLGRSDSNSVAVSDDRVSRRHALIQVQPENEFWL